MKKVFRLNGILSLAMLLCLGFMASCDDDDEDDVTPDDNVVEEVLQEEYIADLSPLNNSGVSGRVLLAYIDEADGDFDVSVEADGLAANEIHPQYIYSQGTCPTDAAAGDDGLLTQDEGVASYGEVLIPLDNDLVPLEPNGFPRATTDGMVDYTNSVNLETLTDVLDGIDSGDDLDLENRTVVLHGAYVLDGEIVSPDTEGAEYNETLPVACGEIRDREDDE